MVIGEKFAWAHLPKAGGSATRTIFMLFPELVLYADPLGNNDAHVKFVAREEQIRGKVLAMNIRRLPSYVLSWSQISTVHRLELPHDPGPMPSPHEMSLRTYPDRHLKVHMGKGKFTIDRWFRMEQLADDLLEFISEYTDVSDQQRKSAMELRMNVLDYDHELAHWFTPQQIETMYRMNPNWSAIEEQVYGGTLAAADALG